MKPLQPQIHLIGFPGCHGQVQEVFNDFLSSMNTSSNETNKKYCVRSLNFREKAEQVLPCFAGKFAEPSVPTTELGLLKYSQLKKVALTSPSATVLVFDWREDPAIHDWSLLMTQITAEIIYYRENCSSSSKIMVMVLLPNAEKDLSPNTIEDRSQLLKKSLAQSEHAEFAKNFLLVQSGIDGLKVQQKKFGKALFDLSQGYYAEQKTLIKKETKKILKEQLENIRFNFMHGVYSEI